MLGLELIFHLEIGSENGRRSATDFGRAARIETHPAHCLCFDISVAAAGMRAAIN